MSRSWIAALLVPAAALFVLPCLLPAAQPDPVKKGNAKGKLSASALAKRIDKHISERWQKEGVKPVEPADDATFFRRVHLDLAGKIPSVLDISDFLDDDRADKRAIWIDQIIDGENFADHFASVYRHMMLGGSQENEQTIFFIGPFENWVRKKFKENTPYNKMVHELLTSNPQGNPNFGGPGGDLNNASPAAFFAVNENKAENLAGATARVFLGVKIECAQCHKHPFADWTQTQFWEFAAFFVNVNQNFGPQPVPVPDSKDGPPQPPQPNNPSDGPQIQIPKKDPPQFVKAKFLDGKTPKWQGGQDPRRVLADWITAPENPYFARMAVNFAWTYFFGVGLVDPVDDFGKHNPASHPELLDELADQFARNGYDLKYLMKAIVNSKIYQLSSAPLNMKGKSDDDPEDLTRLYARMPLRALSGEQLFDSIAEVMEYKVDKSRVGVPGLGQTPREEFLSKFSNPENKRIDTHTSILQALHLMNGKFMANATSLEKNKTLATIAASDADTAKRVRTLFLVALSRQPTPAELDRMTKYIDSGGATNDRNQALADVMWALLNSAEFAINH
jgi:hypothetical protein